MKPSPSRAFQLKSYDFQERRFRGACAAADEANRRMGEALGAELGAFSVTPRLYDDLEHMDVQIRSSPLPAMGGGEFRCKLPYGDLSGHALSLAEDVFTEARHFIDSRAIVAARVEAAREIAGQMPDRHECAFAPATVTAIGHYAAPSGFQSHFITIMDLEVLGPALTPITERVFAANPADLERKLDVMFADHARRGRLLAMLLANRSRGSIQETGRRVLSAVGMNLGFALDQLEKRSELVFDFDHGRQKCALTWEDGVLKCSLWMQDGTFALNLDALWFTPNLPHTLLGALPGRRLGAFVESAFLPADAIITAFGEQHAGEISLTLAIPTVSLPAGRRPLPKSPRRPTAVGARDKDAWQKAKPWPILVTAGEGSRIAVSLRSGSKQIKKTQPARSNPERSRQDQS